MAVSLGKLEAEAIAYSAVHEITGTVSEVCKPLQYESSESSEELLGRSTPPTAEEPSSDVLVALCDLQDVPPVESAAFHLPLRAETWPVEEVRRHWLLANHHCEWLLIPLAYPSLRMPTSLGAYYWRRHTTDARQSPEFMAQEARCVSAALRDLAMQRPQPEQLIWCEQLMASVSTDPMAREWSIRRFAQFLTQQHGLLMVCLENARLEQREAMPLLRDLGAATGGHLRRLYLWRAFRRHLDPIARRRRGKTRDPCARGVWRRGPTRQAPAGPAQLPLTLALPLFSRLAVLAADYCDLADPCGEALLTLAAVRVGALRRLHLLVVEQELPRRSQGGESFGSIPDWAWRRACTLCPDLRVHLVICACPTYDMVSSVWSRSMPLAQLHLSSGIDSRFRQPWLLDCVFREMRIWFSHTLGACRGAMRTCAEYLAMHLWRNRDLLDADLIRAPTDFVHLVELEFIGRFEDLRTIQRVCAVVLKGCVYDDCPRRPLKRLVLRPQLSLDSRGLDSQHERRVVNAFSKEYEPRLAAGNVLLECSPFPT